MIYKFGDEENTWGKAEINIEEDLLLRHLEVYKKLDEENGYNIDDFYLYLEEKGYKIKRIKDDVDSYVYF